MTGRGILLACVLLLPANCGDNTAPDYTKPLAEWRQTGVPVRLLPTVGGPTLQVPATKDGLCMAPEPSNSYAGCVFHLDEASARLATDKTEYDQRLDVEMVFERDRFTQLRNEARIGAEQRAGSDGPGGGAPVEQVLTGTSRRQRFASGCWRRLAVNTSGTGLDVNGPYACTLVIENRSLGATVVDYSAPPPAVSGMPLDRARIDRLVAAMAAIEASFLPRPVRAETLSETG